MNDNYQINAVLEEDLLKILQSFNKVEELNSGKCYCFCCGNKLTLSSISSIHIIDGLLYLKCDDFECEIEQNKK